MIFRSDDPGADFDRWDAYQTKQLESLPCCADCGDPIQQEFAVYKDGEWFCDSCIDAYRREIER